MDDNLELAIVLFAYLPEDDKRKIIRLAAALASQQ